MPSIPRCEPFLHSSSLLLFPLSICTIHIHPSIDPCMHPYLSIHHPSIHPSIHINPSICPYQSIYPYPMSSFSIFPALNPSANSACSIEHFPSFCPHPPPPYLGLSHHCLSLDYCNNHLTFLPFPYSSIVFSQHYSQRYPYKA